MRQEIEIPRINVTSIVVIALVVLVLMGASSVYYTVEPEEVGIVLRLGRYTGAPKPPGLHFKLPFGIDQVEKVPVLRQEKEEFGFRTSRARYGESSAYIDHARRPELLNESLMVTGDLNAAMVEWIVQYRIVEPTEYLFNVRNVSGTLRNTTEAVMRAVVGDRTVDEVLTVGRQEIEMVAKQRLQDAMNNFKMGISIEQVVLQDVTPPDAVKDSFNKVNEAQQERERLINEARAEYNQAVPRARGLARQQIQEAEGYAVQRVNQAEGDVARFLAMLDEYVKAPEVTRRRIYLETMQEVLPRVGRKILVDEDMRQLLPLLNVGDHGKTGGQQP